MAQLISDEEKALGLAALAMLELWKSKLHDSSGDLIWIQTGNDAIDTRATAIKTRNVIHEAIFALDDALGYLVDADETVVMNADGKTGRVYYGGILQPDLIAELGASTWLGADPE